MSKKTNVSKAVVDKVQWGTRIHPDFRRAVKVVSAMTDLAQDDLAELGLAVLMGVDMDKKDSAVNVCRDRIIAAAKRSGQHLPTERFEKMVRDTGFEPVTPTVSR